MSEFYQETTHRSLKRRRCEATGAWIEIGDEYVSARGVWEGDFFCVSLHPVGCKAYRKCFDLDGGFDLAFQETLEYLIDSHKSDQLTEEAAEVAKLNGVPDWFKKRVSERRNP